MKALSKISFIAIISLICVFAALNSADAAGFTFTRDLNIGSNGDDVSALQQFLIAGGFLKIPTPTGSFGPLTRAALSAWQTSMGIHPSIGFFGPASRGKINATARQALIKTNPVRLKIPKLNIDAGFQQNSLKPDGTMEIPNNVVDVGWFTGSARPGEKGTAIITGHVAQIRKGVVTKQGVFYDLDKLRTGDKLYVINDKGESIAFVVREIRSYDPAADATDVFISKDNGVHLNLITCEGTWNSAKASYTQRLVIFTDAAR